MVDDSIYKEIQRKMRYYFCGYVINLVEIFQKDIAPESNGWRK